MPFSAFVPTMTDSRSLSKAALRRLVRDDAPGVVARCRERPLHADFLVLLVRQVLGSKSRLFDTDSVGRQESRANLIIEVDAICEDTRVRRSVVKRSHQPHHLKKDETPQRGNGLGVSRCLRCLLAGHPRAGSSVAVPHCGDVTGIRAADLAPASSGESSQPSAR
ncbi:hypothetical protein HPB47_020684 [Ixodes persulcatus]|uniref:Uncharacterized protein n=1 Tax=Ixodes persulcatus TaxID=34615 RepID=A0AC60QEL8_IXOPE|nr:hypothetical protein HPB47_020684 [Ixodes persulcatus]